MSTTYQQQQVLQAHPSVQDLDIDTYRVNPAKAHYHNLIINNGPLHAPSEHGKSSVVKKSVPKNQTVKVAKNEENLKLAALARRIPSEIAAPLASLPQGVADKPSSAVGQPNKFTVRSASSSQAVRPASKGTAPLPQSTTTKAALPPVPQPRRPSSTVSSAISYEASDAESFSVYSCSCCHVKVPSSNASSAVHASDYDNLTSISQRPSNHPSVSSSKLRVLEDELKKEREDRIKTQSELESIRVRQQFLLSKLSKEERDQLKKLMGDSK